MEKRRKRVRQRGFEERKEREREGGRALPKKTSKRRAPLGERERVKFISKQKTRFFLFSISLTRI